MGVEEEGMGTPHPTQIDPSKSLSPQRICDRESGPAAPGTANPRSLSQKGVEVIRVKRQLGCHLSDDRSRRLMPGDR